MLMRKVLCIVGTRPEAIKMAPVIKLFQQQSWTDVHVVSTGQHREMVKQTLDVFGVAVHHDLDVMVPNQTLAGLSARVFERLDPLLARIQPDIILVQGDTTSVMIAALAAFYRKIPVGHVEAGLRTHDLLSPFPEELNRVIAGLVSTLHFAPTQRSFDTLIAEGKPAGSVFMTGNTVIDALLELASQPLPDPTFATGKKLVLVTAHRRENFGEPLLNVCKALRRLHDTLTEFEFVYPVHPNPNVREPVQANLSGLPRFHLVEPLGYSELIAVLKKAHFVITDSGGLQEEAPALGNLCLLFARRLSGQRPLKQELQSSLVLMRKCFFPRP